MANPRIDQRAFTQGYAGASNEAQRALDRLTFYAGVVAGLAERGDHDSDRMAEARDDLTEQLRTLRLAVDDLDAVIGNHLHGGHLLGGPS